MTTKTEGPATPATDTAGPTTPTETTDGVLEMLEHIVAALTPDDFVTVERRSRLQQLSASLSILFYTAQSRHSSARKRRASTLGRSERFEQESARWSR